jgi:multiple sugar transport system substrate-binding protein
MADLNSIKAKFSRRKFLKGMAVASAGSVLVACAPAATQAPAAAPTTAPAAATEAPAAATEAPAATTAPTAAAPAAGPVKLRFITNHGAADQPLFQTVLDNFKAKAANITIDHLDIADGNDFYNSINTQGAAKQLPDIWYTRTFDVPVYASKDWTLSMEDMVKADAAEVNVDDFWPGEVAQMRYQGKLYALPYDFSNIGIYFNKTVFAKAGVDLPPATWKWDDLATLGQKFVKKDSSGAFNAWGLVLYTWNWVFMGLMYGWGGKVFSDDLASCVINTPANVDCLKWFIAQRKLGLFPDAGSAPAGVDPFMANLVPMEFQGSWATVAMRDAVKDKFEYDCTTMPLSPSGASCINAAGGAWGIAKNTADPAASWTFTKFLTSTESTNVLISDPLRSIPGRKSSAARWTEVASKGGLPPKNVAVFEKQNETAVAQPYPAFWQAFGNVWGNMIDPLINGTTDTDPGEVLAQVQDEVNRQAKQ